MSLQMKTIDTVAVAPGALHDEWYLKINSTFDPTGDVGATQPVGRDQIATLYNSYIVDSGMVKFTYANSNAVPSTIAAYISGTAAAVAAVGNNYMGQPGAKYKAMGPLTGNCTAIIKLPFKCSNVLGPLDRSQHGAASGADPTTMVYLHFIIESTANVTGTLTIEIIQNVTWYDKVANIHA